MTINDLAFGLCFEDLYDHLERVDAAFLSFLKERDVLLYEKLLEGREMGELDGNSWYGLSCLVEEFVCILFSIETQVQETRRDVSLFNEMLDFKRRFIHRYALIRYGVNALGGGGAFEDCGVKDPQFFDKTFFNLSQKALADDDQDSIEKLAHYAAFATLTKEGRRRHKGSSLFQKPEPMDATTHLKEVPYQAGRYELPFEEVRGREGFSLTDLGLNRAQALSEAHYCIKCHKKDKDSCSKGLKSSSHEGCPLDQKISQMNLLVGEGYRIAALAIVTLDNPMVAATGNRICNECKKACIYQKQTPVDIPGVETNLLRDVLILDYGFEIYSLLTRWNPLNTAHPYAKPCLDKSVLVVGMGPSGFTLAHYLMNQGFKVVGIDALKIEPLDLSLVERSMEGAPLFLPIRHIESFFKDLDRRPIQGFGGVMEYGITVRYDKNMLFVIRLLLHRRHSFKLFSGIRFGSQITHRDAFELGFLHIALCMGAGSSTLIDIPNTLAKGVMMASDFLMTLQLGGSFQRDSLTTLDVDLPAIVIGGGLTAVDTACEFLTYYRRHVERFYTHVQAIENKDTLTKEWTIAEKERANRWISHHEALKKTTNTQEQMALLRSWGGVTLLYRKKITESPAYRLNHEELLKAFEEGICVVDEAKPLFFSKDSEGHVNGVCVMRQAREETFSCRTVLIAAGTKPNQSLRHDDPLFESPVLEASFFLEGSDQKISIFGDQNPHFNGSVVRAMASAKKGAPLITAVMNQQEERALLPLDWQTRVEDVVILTPTIVQLTLYSPLSVHHFRPGHFFKLQTFEAYSNPIEPIALTGAKVDLERHLITLIALEMGVSTKQLRTLKKGDPVVLMGPAGKATYFKEGETILLIGGGLGNAVLFSLGEEMRKKGCHVLYFAGYKKSLDRFRVEDIQNAADCVVWVCDESLLVSNRKGDLSFKGNMIEALIGYAQGDLKGGISLNEVDRLVVIGSSSLMGAIQTLCQGILSPFLKKNAIASINSPMQCMMKEVCARCLQRHVDPLTGQATFVYSCVNQDQNLFSVDFDFLNKRLATHRISEHLYNRLLIQSSLDEDNKSIQDPLNCNRC